MGRKGKEVKRLPPKQRRVKCEINEIRSCKPSVANACFDFSHSFRTSLISETSACRSKVDSKERCEGEEEVDEWGGYVLIKCFCDVYKEM